jgi:hypothetical protein
LLIFTFLISGGYANAAAQASREWVHKTVFGVFLHDRGPTSDHHESGVDPNWEIQLNPPAWSYWQWLGSPFPMVGLTPNFNGDSSVFYAEL